MQLISLRRPLKMALLSEMFPVLIIILHMDVVGEVSARFPYLVYAINPESIKTLSAFCHPAIDP